MLRVAFSPLEDDDLIFTSKGKPFNRNVVLRTLKKRAIELGIKNELGTHSFRRAVATTLDEQGIPVEQIAKALGHKNINTTKKYIKRKDKIEESPLLKLSY